MFRVQADDERARLAEKRSIYARYMATLTGDLAAVTRLGAEKGASAELRGALLDNLDRASIEMLQALNELILIAPRRLGDLVENSARELQRYGAAAERDEKAELNFPEIRDILIKEMRSDLAEPDSDG